MLATAREVKENSYVAFSSGLQYMDTLVMAEKQKLTSISSWLDWVGSFVMACPPFLVIKFPILLTQSTRAVEYNDWISADR